MSAVSNSDIKIKFTPSSKQFEAWEYLFDEETIFVGYGGAAYSGKSYLLCYWILTMCIAYPETVWGIGRKELTTLKKTTLKTLFKVFDECGIINGSHYNLNQQTNIITFYNKSQIFLIDTDSKPSDPLFTRFGGLELTGCAIDESAETKEEAITILQTRIGRKKNNEYKIKAKFLETFNPSKDHIYQRYYKPWKENILSRYYKFVKALPEDNPAPDVAEYVNGIISNGSMATIERLVYGNFEYDDDPKVLMAYDKILELFTNEFIEPKPEKYLIADIAYEGSDIFVIGIWHGLVLTKIIAMDKCDETQVSKVIHEHRVREGIPLGNVLYDADGIKKFVKQSAASGYLNGAKQFHNNGKALNDENYYNLKSQCYFKLSSYTNSNKIFIFEKNYRKQIIEELEQIKKIENSDDGKLRIEKKDDLKQRLKRSPDFADMLMMRMFFEIKPKIKQTFATAEGRVYEQR